MVRSQAAPCRVVAGLKMCPNCGKVREVSCFSKSARAKSGLQTYCKLCVSALCYEARNANLEHRKRIERASRARHPYTGAYCMCKKRALKARQELCSRDDFIRWYVSQPKKCVYCSVNEQDAIRLFKHKLHIDRKDGPQGYVIGNIALACQRCNLIKNGYLTYEEMKEIGSVYIKPKVFQDLSKVL